MHRRGEIADEEWLLVPLAALQSTGIRGTCDTSLGAVRFREEGEDGADTRGIARDFAVARDRESERKRKRESEWKNILTFRSIGWYSTRVH